MPSIPTPEQKKALYQQLIAKFGAVLPVLKEKQAVFDFVIKELSNLPHYQWTGIYEYDTPQEMLTLHPFYVGLPTGHTSIQKGQGVCGTAVARNQDIVIKDVTKLDNYLACSTGTKSEIVVLLKQGEAILGQIDVDSDLVGAFTDLDRSQLAQIADLVVKNLP